MASAGAVRLPWRYHTTAPKITRAMTLTPAPSNRGKADFRGGAASSALASWDVALPLLPLSPGAAAGPVLPPGTEAVAPGAEGVSGGAIWKVRGGTSGDGVPVGSEKKVRGGTTAAAAGGSATGTTSAAGDAGGIASPGATGTSGTTGEATSKA